MGKIEIRQNVVSLSSLSFPWCVCRSVENRQKADFFKRDFTQDESCRIAKKNAFHLMGRQKFYDSAALFLLAGSLHDAVMVSQYLWRCSMKQAACTDYADQFLE